MSENNDLTLPEVYVNIINTIWGSGTFGDNIPGNINSSAIIIVNTVFNSIRTCSLGVGITAASPLLVSFITFLGLHVSISTIAELILAVNNSFIPELEEGGLLDDYEAIATGGINSGVAALINLYLTYIQSHGFGACIVTASLIWKSALAAALAGIDIKIQPSDLLISHTECEIIKIIN